MRYTREPYGALIMFSKRLGFVYRKLLALRRSRRRIWIMCPELPPFTFLRCSHILFIITVAVIIIIIITIIFSINWMAFTLFRHRPTPVISG